MLIAPKINTIRFSLACDALHGAAGRPRSGLMRALVLGIITWAVILATETPTSALIITPTFDSTITSNANAAAIEGSINAAIGIFQSQFSTPITVAVDFRYDTTTPCGTPSGFIAASCSWQYSSDYAPIVAALTAQATTANDATAVAHLPGSIPETFIVTSSADTRALGCATCPGNEPGGFDGIVTLNSSAPLQFSRSGGILAGNYDAQTASEHEIDEVLGIGGICDGGTILPCTTFNGQSAIGIMDLFRYSAPGVRSLTTDPSATAYFSIDGGATDIVGFNQSGVGDYGDFASGCFVQSFAGCTGVSADVTLSSPEGVALDVIGYDPVSVPEPSVSLLLATGFSLLFASAIAVRRKERAKRAELIN